MQLLYKLIIDYSNFMTKQINNNASFSFIHALHTPPPIFTIYDYSQIVYPLQNSYLFFQNLQSSACFYNKTQINKNGLSQLDIDWHYQPQKKNSFFKIRHKVNQFHFIGSTKDFVVSLESAYTEINCKVKKQSNILDGIMSQIKITSSPNNKVVEKENSKQKNNSERQEQLFLVIYNIQSGNQFVIKIDSSLLNRQIKAKYRCALDSQQKLAVVTITVVQKSGILNQFVYIDLHSKLIRANGLIQGNICSVSISSLNSFSVMTDNQMGLSSQRLHQYFIEYVQDKKQYKIVESGVYNIFQSNAESGTGSTKNVLFQRHYMINGQYVLFAEQGTLVATFLNNRLEYLHNYALMQKQATGYAVHQSQKGFIVLKFPYLAVWQKETTTFTIKKVIKINQNFKTQVQSNNKKIFANLVMSQQQNLIAFHISTQHSHKILFNSNFSHFLQNSEQDCREQIQKQVQKSRVSIHIQDSLKQGLVIEEVTFRQLSLSYRKSGNFYGGNQQFFIWQSGNLIRVMNTSTFNSFLSVSIERDLGTSVNVKQPINECSQAQISTIAIHPTEPLIAVAFINSIRVYKILLQQLLLLKQIPLSRCKYLIFNNSGSILSAVVVGKQGTKAYLYNSAKYEYNLIETISIGKKILSLLWGNLDSRVFIVFQSGYFYWDVGDTFKIRKQSAIKFIDQQNQKLITKGDLPFKFEQSQQQPKRQSRNNSKNSKGIIPSRLVDSENKRKKRKDCISQQIKGATMGMNNELILWSQRTVYRISNHEQIDEEINSETSNIKQVIYKNGVYIFHMQDGLICLSRGINFNASVDKGLQIIPRLALTNNTLSYQISHIFANKFICQGKTGNALIFSSANTFQKQHSLQRQGKKSLGNTGKHRNQVVMMSKKNVQNVLMKHRVYQAQIVQLRKKTQNQIDDMKVWFNQQIQTQEKVYLKEIQTRDNRIKAMKDEIYKMCQNMEQKQILQQQKSMSQVKDLEKLYERKLALITNKHLTSQQIIFRQKIVALNQIKELDQRHHYEIEKVRQAYQGQISGKCSTAEQMQRQVLNLKKEYETKILAIEQQSQQVLAAYQEKMEQKIQILKKNAVAWQGKFGQCLSKKDNIQKQHQQQILSKDLLKQKLQYLENKKDEAVRRSENLVKQVQRMESILGHKSQTIEFLEKRVQDLEKSNQILKFRVLELKESNDPKQLQIDKMKQNLHDLEDQYEKIMKSAHDSEQKVVNLKRQNSKLKQASSGYEKKLQKISKRYEDLVGRVRQSTKLPYQQIRKQLISIINSFTISTKQKLSTMKQVSDNPLGQLNRIRQHLETTLGQVVQSNKKSEQQRKAQMMRRNHQNSQLLQQINNLRRRIKVQQEEIKQKDRVISEFKIDNNVRDVRASENFSTSFKQKQKSVERQQLSLSKDFTRNKTRQTFYEKSLFKTYWKGNTKRMKTQQGSRRKKSTCSIARENVSYAAMVIEPSFEQIQHLKKVIDQKETIIKQLISKVHNR